jgi:hypothetical protein
MRWTFFEAPPSRTYMFGWVIVLRLFKTLPYLLLFHRAKMMKNTILKIERKFTTSDNIFKLIHITACLRKCFYSVNLTFYDGLS